MNMRCLHGSFGDKCPIKLLQQTGSARKCSEYSLVRALQLSELPENVRRFCSLVRALHFGKTFGTARTQIKTYENCLVIHSAYVGNTYLTSVARMSRVVARRQGRSATCVLTHESHTAETPPLGQFNCKVLYLTV